MSRRRAYLMLSVIVVVMLAIYSTMFFGKDINNVTPTQQPSAAINAGAPNSTTVHALSINVNMTSTEFANLQKLATEYENDHEDIQIQLNNIHPAPGQTYYDSLKLKAQLGKMADVTLMDTNWIEEFAALGYLDAVDEHFVNATPKTTGTYVESCVQPLKWNGFYWGVPFDFDPYVLVYRDEIIKKYNLTSPDGELNTWFQQIQAIHQSKVQKLVPLYLNANDPYELLVLDSSVLAEAVKKQGISSEELEIRIPKSLGQDQLWSDFIAGRWVYMITPLSAALKHQSELAPITITTIPQLQTVVNREGLLFEGRSFAVAKTAVHQKEAIQFLNFISNKAILANWYGSTKQLPSIIESYASKKLQSTVPQIILERLDSPVHSLAKPDFPDRVGELMTTIDAVWAGKETVETLIDTLNELRVTQ